MPSLDITTCMCQGYARVLSTENVCAWGKKREKDENAFKMRGVTSSGLENIMHTDGIIHLYKTLKDELPVRCLPVKSDT